MPKLSPRKSAHLRFDAGDAHEVAVDETGAGVGAATGGDFVCDSVYSLTFFIRLLCLSRFMGKVGVNDLSSYSSPLNFIKGVVPACVPKVWNHLLGCQCYWVVIQFED